MDKKIMAISLNNKDNIEKYLEQPLIERISDDGLRFDEMKSSNIESCHIVAQNSDCVEFVLNINFKYTVEEYLNEDTWCLSEEWKEKELGLVCEAEISKNGYLVNFTIIGLN
ncbi:hypothetical protein [Tissierella pigra]|uniref:Uncharacterized protein n=1 Tax=Tissierella pigra TaxID=2607614 RepID=A0A6N7XGH8_9FIRM|nr:hypothetical protein [Tissierella pigra]MSU01151.1 hypothetical protein [Tissierella pigra]